MALNPPLGETGEPFRIEGEHFVMQRRGIDFEVKVEGLGKFKGSGFLVLTTNRMVLINFKNIQKSDFKSFDIPHALTFKEKFNQPIFGANYWSGTTKPLFNQLPNDAEFKIWFMEGGCGKFNKVYRYTLAEIRKHQGRAGPNPLIQEFTSNSFQQQFAYFDPNDPSTIYISQPPIQQQTMMQPPGTQQQPMVIPPQGTQQQPMVLPPPTMQQQPMVLPPPSSQVYQEEQKSSGYPQMYNYQAQSFGQQWVAAGTQMESNFAQLQQQREQQQLQQQQQQQQQNQNNQQFQYNYQQQQQPNYGYSYTGHGNN